MVLTLHNGTVGIDHLLLRRSIRYLSLTGPSGEADFGFQSRLPLQLVPIYLSANLLDLPGSINLLARFLFLHQLAATVLSIV